MSKAGAGKARKGIGLDFTDLPPLSGAAAPPVAEPYRPVTGLGLMSAAVAGAQELEQRVQALQAEAEQLRQERGAQPLDPMLIRASRWANRHELSFAGPDFEALKAEIADARGNVQPIKVRPLPQAQADRVRYEIVFGHRRHRACLELGLPVLAVVQELGDRDLFTEMDRENRARKSLSAYEQGLMYRRALEEGLFPSLRMLAAAVGADAGNVSRAIRVAELPTEVLAAFGSPLEVQFAWASPLAAALERDREAALAAARQAAQARLGPAQAYAAITGKAPRRGGVVPYNTPVATAARGGQGGAPVPRRISLGRGAYAQVRVHGARTVLEFDSGLLEAEGWPALEKALRAVLGRK
ncbi:ParB/RepB/Spo0J family partition protein [Azohydromonas caseinilytica]|uniref:ParB/RepB/Spo0J family partition protein n=1 Tax=Azohydromonas caseinilytica TaxID=2728836 RepID=A0A848FJS5_9BURK|nr:ParB/RepB/Spo0J family partition protein [Azohydromonas caseinilytica]NML19135.1 ParB/RepB/Spo0J family partition protein [Azohydromonas caseinilytica]